MRIAIFGTGYVGLVTGACFAEAGNDVLCIDVDAAKIAALNNGDVPIFEPGLDEMLARNRRARRIRFTTDAAEAVAHAQLQVIAVGTPASPDGSTDLRFVRTVAETIGQHMTDDKVVIVKSTVPVGTADLIQEIITDKLASREVSCSFAVASNPEFLKEGAAIEDFMRPDRIVVGTENPAVIELMRDLYAPFNRNHNRLMIMDVHSAELTKYAANALLATKISFMNEIANLAERVGANIEHVRAGIGSDPRIGYHFIYAGSGYGGSCFPKDIQALVHTARSAGLEPQLLQAVEAVNQQQKRVLFAKIARHFADRGGLAGRTIALWGLAFKPNTDDIREAPSRTLMEALWEAGARVQAYDPGGMDAIGRIYGARADLTLCPDAESALRGADALAIITEWRQFRSPDFLTMRRMLREPVIFDGRNIYDPDRLAAEGFIYYGIGTGLPLPVDASESKSEAVLTALASD